VQKNFFSVKALASCLGLGLCFLNCGCIGLRFLVFCGAFQHSLWCASAWFVVRISLPSLTFVYVEMIFF
jgi:hypothetical protein